jgi:tyrosyl-tRNA synthetase
MTNVVDVLRSRGLFEDMTSEELPRFCEKPAVVYAGFDPTSESLQVGNFVTIMALAHFQRCGHNVVALVGGATGMIGDPSGKSSERNLLSPEQVEKNLVGIRENLSRFLDFDHPTAPAVIVNNHDWISKFSYIDFLREVGKHFRVNAMMARESVKKRMESDTGISYTEFSYQLIQAYDFLHLHNALGVRVQIGGSDQWGNITAGTELVRRLGGEEAYGLTFPIICDSTGRKFGKSEGNSIYLDANKTSYYDFYQFFIRTEDADVIRFLKIFTFLPLEEIAGLETELAKAPEARMPHRKLAEEMTRCVHGAKGLRIAQEASRVLFGGELTGLTADELLAIFANVSSMEMSRAKAAGLPVVDLAVEAGLCKSKGETRRLIASGGLYLNGRRVEKAEETVQPGDMIEGRVIVLRSGKKTFHLIKLAG